MYLYKKTYVKNWDHTRPEERHEVLVTKNGKPTSIKPNRVTEVTEQVGYWRKANAIHSWFVKNVQDGKDECQDAYVETGELKRLLQTVKEALANPLKAPELLPSQSGFFFGPTNYDEHYFRDLRDTKKILEEVLSEESESGLSDIYYHSSW